MRFTPSYSASFVFHPVSLLIRRDIKQARWLNAIVCYGITRDSRRNNFSLFESVIVFQHIRGNCEGWRRVREGGGSARITARIRNNAANFSSDFPRIKGSPLFTCAFARSWTTSEINCHRIVEWNRYWNTGEKSLISQTLIKRHDNFGTRYSGRGGPVGEGNRWDFIPDEAAGVSEINTVDIFSSESIDSRIFIRGVLVYLQLRDSIFAKIFI